MRKFIGDKGFYKRLFAVMIPVLIQNVITNFVSLLDNIMVGQVGTEPMSGVAIVNQLLFVFNLCVFATSASAGIFTAQFFGKGDNDGIQKTFRLKLWFVLGVFAAALVVLLSFGETFIGLFLTEGEENLSLSATMDYAKDYLAVMYWGLLPFAVSQAYGSTLRETGETVVPMRAGIAAVFVNLIFNYILIFGKLGAPALGVAGAAIATVISRYVECLIIVIWAHAHGDRHPYMKNIYATLSVPAELTGRVIKMGFPLLLNEFLWSSGMTILNQCYSTRGLEVVSACNISSTVSNLFFCAFFAMGTTIAIIIGQLLGAGQLERAVDEDRKLIAFAVVLCAAVGGIMAVLAPDIPEIYNTTASVKTLASSLITVSAAMMPVNAFTNSCYFTLRSGGKTWITFAFDSAYVWALCIPTAFILSRFTAMAIIPMYVAVQSLELFKCIIGFVMLKKRAWVNNLVAE